MVVLGWILGIQPNGSSDLDKTHLTHGGIHGAMSCNFFNGKEKKGKEEYLYSAILAEDGARCTAITGTIPMPRIVFEMTCNVSSGMLKHTILQEPLSTRLYLCLDLFVGHLICLSVCWQN